MGRSFWSITVTGNTTDRLEDAVRLRVRSTLRMFGASLALSAGGFL
jgi:hypothetical protein